jgi:asparagine synthase (glutamine-hydrolysing)
MCGILGIVTEHISDSLRNRFSEALDLQQHRGPDARGILSPAEGVLFGHRRLSIIDLSAAGNQPMQNETGNLTIVFNGEIYNFQELREELVAKGHTFFSRSDTEVLLHGYEEYGIDSLLPKLIGMFAFALYDKDLDTLYLVRDRLGVKPLYYQMTPQGFVFASEIKSILYLNFSPAQLNPVAISSYLSYRMVLGTATFFQGIQLLEPGHYLTLKERACRLQRYWELPRVSERPDRGPHYYLRETRERVLSAVKRRLISDVPLGAYLSGGLDSSILVALMARLNDVPPKTFAVGFADEDFNEFKYAKLVQERYQTDHTEILLDSNQFMNALPQVIHLKDSPVGVPNEIALYLMSKELKKHITVVMSGEGADEMFGGYGRIFRSPFDYQQRYAGIRNGDTSQFTANYRAKYGERDFASEMEHFLWQYRWLSIDEKWQVLSNDFRQTLRDDSAIREFWQTRFDAISQLSHYDKYLYLFQTVHLQGLLLRLDTATMGASVESRNPFVDHEIVEFCAAMPFEYKLRWRSEEDRVLASSKNSSQISEVHDITKYALRMAFADDLPSEIVARKKMGFPVPLHRWLGGKFLGLARSVLLDPVVCHRGLFNVATLERWLNDPSHFESHEFGLKVWMLMNVEMFLSQYRL